ncbi:mechanosensitive ion channel [Paramuricea clavata]|uniref:Mechanosensitive ion channel n=1 Tax=Paramuricea clavata TaxID=317549 RepID=A0A7D9I6W0_PARCT|nr:mechanosensitive ion channel [Paramuricea clavata]
MSCERSLQELNDLSKEIRSEGGVSIKNRVYLFKTYLSCFIGYDLIDWFIKTGHAQTGADAVKLGEDLLNANIIHHVLDRHHFRDHYLFYRFRQDDPPNDVNSGPNVASLKAECGAKFSWAKSPGFVFWCKHYYVLKNEDTTLYEFKTDLDSSPYQKYDLKDATVAVDNSADYCIALKLADLQMGSMWLNLVSSYPSSVLL